MAWLMQFRPIAGPPYNILFVFFSAYRKPQYIWSSNWSHAIASHPVLFSFTAICIASPVSCVFWCTLFKTFDLQFNWLTESSLFHLSHLVTIFTVLWYVMPRLSTKIGPYFDYAGPAAWKLLPISVCSQTTVEGFQRALKTQVFVTTFNVRIWTLNVTVLFLYCTCVLCVMHWDNITFFITNYKIIKKSNINNGRIKHSKSPIAVEAYRCWLLFYRFCSTTFCVNHTSYRNSRNRRHNQETEIQT